MPPTVTPHVWAVPAATLANGSVTGSEGLSGSEPQAGRTAATRTTRMWARPQGGIRPGMYSPPATLTTSRPGTTLSRSSRPSAYFPGRAVPMLWSKVRKASFSILAGLLCLAPASLVGQTGTISGTVRDASARNPIAGVQIGVVGTLLATLSDQQGNYTLANVPVGRVTVRVRRLGFSGVASTVEVSADAPATLDFALSASVITLDEVVVTGAGGAVAKKQLGNTIATVDSSAIKNAPVQSFSEAIAGREPGVQVLPSSGLVGEGARIRIRGNASLSQNNEPVVYVDGVRVDNGGGFTYAGAAGAPKFSFRVDQGLSQSPHAAYKPIAGFARYADLASCVADAAAFGRTTAAQTGACRSTIGVADRLSAIYGRTIAPYQVFETDFINDFFGTGYHSTYAGDVRGGGEAVLYYVAARLAREDGPFRMSHLDAAAPANDYNRKAYGSANITLFPRRRVQLRAGAMFTDVHHETPNNANNIYGVISSAINSKPEQSDCEESRKLGLGGAFGQDTTRSDRCAGPAIRPGRGRSSRRGKPATRRSRRTPSTSTAT